MVYYPPISTIDLSFIFYFHCFFRALHVLLSLYFKLNGEHYELKIHENLFNTFMAYSQYIQMFFMSFSGFYFSGFSWV